MISAVAIIKKELYHFFKDRKMIVGIILPGILVFLLYSFLGQVIQSESDDFSNTEYKIACVNRPGDITQFAFWENVIDIGEDDIKEYIGDVESGDWDIVICFDEGFNLRDWEEGVTEKVSVYYNSSNSKSASAYSYIIAVLQTVEDSVVDVFEINSDDGITYDLASNTDINRQTYKMLVPFIMIVSIISICISVGAESIAGERERGTLTSLLAAPVNRRNIAFGKIGAMTIIGFIGSVCFFIGLMCALSNLTNGGFSKFEIFEVYNPIEYGVILCVILSSTLLIMSVVANISAKAKTVKEASLINMPFSVVGMISSIAVMMCSENQVKDWWFFIPVFNGTEYMYQILNHSAQITHFVFTVITNLIVTLAAVVYLAKEFKKESIIY